MNKHIPYLLVIAFLFIVIGINRCGDGPEPKSTTKLVSDSTVVDSLTKRITYLENLPADTVEVQVEVPSKPDTMYVDSSGVKINEYNMAHIDSIVSAFWTTKTTGVLIDQSFSYVVKNRRVEKEVTTKWLTRVQRFETTIEDKGDAFLAIGGEVGASVDGISLSPIIRLQAKDGYSYHYRYDLINKSHNIGTTIPIRLPRIF